MRRYLKLFLVSIFIVFLAVSSSFSLTVEQVKGMLAKAVREEVLLKHPDYKDAEIKVVFKYADSTLKTLASKPGKIGFALAELYPGFDPIGNVIIPFQVYVDSREAEKIFLRTRVEVWTDVVVASKRLSKKSVLGATDVRMAKQDIGGLSKGFFFDTSTVLGKEMIASVPDGTVLIDWMLRIPPMVSRNEEVTIVAQTDNMRAEAKGLALADGYKGDKIKVRNLDTNKEIKAEVRSSSEVYVELK